MWSQMCIVYTEVTSVCGPTQLSNDTREAVRTAGAASKVYRGQQSITFDSETFGW